jgi:lipoprotein-anchoring transpeptidase ErfK/SrfK
LNKRLIITIVALTVVLIVSIVLIAKSRTPKAPEATSNAQIFLKQAQKSLQEGDMLKARKIYANVIEQYPDSPHVITAQKALEKLNMDLLFSPLKTETSTIYVVKEGDTLGKIAKQFNTTAELLMRSNKLESDLIHPGKRLKVVTVQFSLVVDKSQNTLTLKESDEVVKTYAVSTGVDNTTPTGKFKIVNKLVDPVWYKAGAVVPSGSPENILGTRWLGISEPGYGIHGTTDPQTIGRQITAGCVRMRNADVEELYSIVPVGADVTIVD